MSRRTPPEWKRLDNAAKIFPPTSGKRDTKVFRFACELNEAVDPLFLQQALERTLASFPLFRCILKKGLFWYYLERSDLAAQVHPESMPPCSTLYDKNTKNLLFEVTYFDRRINFEVYHALTDGTGALQFLRILVYYYLTARYAGAFPGGPPPLPDTASHARQADDSFQKHYTSGRAQREKKRTAYRLRGSKLPEYRIRVIEGAVPTQQLLALAHAHHTTLTIFLTSLLIWSVGQEMAMHEKHRPVVVTVPVNLRNYFPSESARNFFSIIEVGYDFSKGSGEICDIIRHIAPCFSRLLTEEALRARLNMLTSIERNVFARIVPLAMKDVVMRLANDIAAAKSTCAVSNVGRITMPDALAPYIRRFSVFVSTAKLQLCLCSFNDALTLSFSSCLQSTEFEKHFFKKLSSLGVDITLSCNRPDI